MEAMKCTHKPPGNANRDIRDACATLAETDCTKAADCTYNPWRHAYQVLKAAPSGCGTAPANLDFKVSDAYQPAVADQPGHDVAQRDRDLLYWHNAFRADPVALVPELEAMIPLFDGNTYNGQREYIEGPSVIAEAIAELKTIYNKHFEPLAWNQYLGAVAKEAATINGRDGTSDHHIYLTEDATEASSYRARIERAGQADSTTVFGESITTGVHEARQIVLDMVIDDGQTNARTRRLNRRQVFNENFHIFAAHTADHTKLKQIVHIEYADAIIGKASITLTHQYDTNAAMTAEICDRQCFEHPLCAEFFLHRPPGSN